MRYYAGMGESIKPNEGGGSPCNRFELSSEWDKIIICALEECENHRDW